jgi:hypothetical protein
MLQSPSELDPVSWQGAVRDVMGAARGGQSSRQVKFINICVLLHHDHHYHHRIISPPSVTHKKAIRPALHECVSLRRASAHSAATDERKGRAGGQACA